MFLLDTEVVWEMRLARERSGDAAVAEWAANHTRDLMFISALALVELGQAAAAVERHDRSAALALRQWIEGPVATAFDGRVLAVDAAVARRASALAYDVAGDAMLAATALEHGLTLATRHPAAFRIGKVRVVNPWRYAREQTGQEDDTDWRQASRTGPFRLRNLFARG